MHHWHEEKTAMNNAVIEWAPFKVKPGIDEKTLLKLSEGLQEGFLAKQKGYRKRELIREEDGQYVDIVWWASIADAEAAMQHIADSPACNAYFAAMDNPMDPDTAPKHFRVVREY
jgi:hypothetical protein